MTEKNQQLRNDDIIKTIAENTNMVGIRINKIINSDCEQGQSIFVLAKFYDYVCSAINISHR